MAGKRTWLGSLPAETGLAGVLVLVCGAFSLATLTEERPEGVVAGEALAKRIARERPSSVMIVAGTGRDDLAFADAVDSGLRAAGVTVAAKVVGTPADAREALEKHHAAVTVIAASRTAGRWTLWNDLKVVSPLTPQSRVWPRFLTADNLLNVANQVAVIAILAAGMTLVLITGHVDLSVGSLIALSAVLGTLLIRRYAGAEGASTAGMVACCAIAVLACGLIGAASGFVVTRFVVPSFIITLGVMKMARGAAFKATDGESVYQLPDAFLWLGRGADLGGIPNAVVLMALLYAAVYALLTRTTFGRYVYAVGGNAEAARLAGVRVRTVVVLVFVLNGLCAGLGGTVLASQLKSGSPTFGVEYELYVIAAVVVGGTSLTGGLGNVLGTLLGAFLLAVIQNGMNLTGVESYDQQIVLGGIIVLAVLLDWVKARANR
jgi:ribose transport system permease protein